MPRDLDEEIDIAREKGTLLERGVSVLVNYVTVPVIIVYALILHAYAVKIMLDGNLPKGQVATMVSIFAVAGTGTGSPPMPLPGLQPFGGIRCVMRLMA